MPMDAQFQLGFELTNILNPATRAVSAISSIAIVDAVRKAGSDVLTEVKLASFLGKNRIDSILEAHFRQAVAKSERNLISRYLEIVLESGAGPTVQKRTKGYSPVFNDSSDVAFVFCARTPAVCQCYGRSD